MTGVRCFCQITCLKFLSLSLALAVSQTQQHIWQKQLNICSRQSLLSIEPIKKLECYLIFITHTLSDAAYAATHCLIYNDYHVEMLTASNYEM